MGFGVALALALAACRPTAETPRPSGPPSIVLISIDTLRADRLGCYGAAGAQTPTLDAWARDGVVFENALTPVPITLPAHATLFTGLLPLHHGVRDNGLYRLPAEVPTLAARLQAAGYDTGAVVGAAVLDRQYGLGHGFRVYDDAVGGSAGLAIAERPAGAVTDAALRVARTLRPPYLLFVHYFDPHATYRPPAPFAAAFRERPYEGEIAFVDSEIGRLKRELGSALESAAIVVTADHGESLGEHGEATHGVFLYQSTLHVPLIVSAPGWPEGRRVAGLASTADVAPTLLEIAGLAPPAGLDGRSLATRAHGDPPPTRGLLLESEFGRNAYGWAPLAGITDGVLKWIRAPEPEFYDLATDPAEGANVVKTRQREAQRLAEAWKAGAASERPTSAGTGIDDAERLAQLASLGYVAGSRAESTDDGVDPKRAIGSLAKVNEARQLMTEGRFDAALAALEPALRSSPRNVSALALSGISHLGASRPRQALGPLRRAATIAPANAEVQFNIGLACVGINDAACAEAAWRRTLQLSPRCAEAAANLTDLLLQTDRPADAQLVLDAARAAALEGPLFDFLTGKLAFGRGDRRAAREPLRRALESRALPPPAAAEARTMLAAGA